MFELIIRLYRLRNRTGSRSDNTLRDTTLIVVIIGSAGFLARFLRHLGQYQGDGLFRENLDGHVYLSFFRFVPYRELLVGISLSFCQRKLATTVPPIIRFRRLCISRACDTLSSEAPDTSRQSRLPTSPAMILSIRQYIAQIRWTLPSPQSTFTMSLTPSTKPGLYVGRLHIILARS